MMLAADALGIGSCPATLHDEDSVRDLLGVPADQPARHAIAFGHPDHEIEPTVRRNVSAMTGRARRPLEDLVKRDRFA
jgi:nitroreductase